MEIWDAKLDLLNNYSISELKKHENLKIEFNRKYFEFNKKFHVEIFESDENYDENEIYSLMKSMGD